MSIWFIISCQPESSFSITEQQTISRMAEPRTPELDTTNRWDGNTKAIAFGERLFFSSDISPSGVTCSQCHDPTMGFSDGLQISEGFGDTERHSPSLFGIASGTWFRWDGGCDSLWCQAIGPIEHQHEMNSSRGDLAMAISNTPELRSHYEEIFGDLPDLSTLSTPAKPDSQNRIANENWNSLRDGLKSSVNEILINTVKSIAAYETTIQPMTAPIDHFAETFLEDEQMALELLTPIQERGLRLFVGEGQCHFCHTGSLFTNDSFHNVGLGSREWLSDVDTGRYDGVGTVQINEFNASGIWSDDPSGERAERLDRLIQTSEQLGQYKTPTLRNLSQTAPYMHGGHFVSLEEVIAHYISGGEVPTQGHTDETIQFRNWDQDDIDAMVQFLLLMDDQTSL